MKCRTPGVYVTSRYGSWSVCACGWKSGLVHGGAIGATVAWALHIQHPPAQDRRADRAPRVPTRIHVDDILQALPVLMYQVGHMLSIDRPDPDDVPAERSRPE